MLFGPDLATLILRIPAIIIAIVVHEFAHGKVAHMLGDPTAHREGRLTFNPLAHLDVVGSLMLLIFGFGWAKPVMVNPHFLKDPKKDMALISLAGPAANIATALVVGRLLIPAGILPEAATGFLFTIIAINVGLGVFNMIPIPPLDGSKILAYFLPPQAERTFYEFANYGILLLIILLFLMPGMLSAVIGPFISFFTRMALGGNPF